MFLVADLIYFFMQGGDSGGSRRSARLAGDSASDSCQMVRIFLPSVALRLNIYTYLFIV